MLRFVINIIILLTVLEEDDTLPTTAKEAQEFQRTFQKNHLPLFLFFTFLNATLVAALVEETVKYFGFWMVNHVDLQQTNSNNNKESQGVGITIAMVATALGFACCENLLYVFVYTPPSLVNQVTTLIARSLFPIHPLAAALQSIGVCKRDLEGKSRTIGLGQIILPAVLLHGSFDFLLMAMTLIQSVERKNDVDNDDDDFGVGDDDAVGQQQQQATTSLVRDQLPSLIASVFIVIVGLAYYVWRAEAQRIRLHDLDLNGGRAQQPSETTRLVV